MNEIFTSDKIKKDEINMNTKESEYKSLISRLSEISLTISLLKKNYKDKL